METLTPRYLITRSVFLIAALVALMYGYGFYKKFHRRSEIVSELKLLASESSYFNQFYAEDAQKTLVKAVGLIAEAQQLGMQPQAAIEGALDIKKPLLETDKREEPAPKTALIQSNLRSNFQNFIKLGYEADYQTLTEMKSGTLPVIKKGPETGKRPIIATIISPELSPGLEKVIANLEIRPTQSAGQAPTDMETATAKQLARDLYEAGLIEDGARKRILDKLTPPKPEAN